MFPYLGDLFKPLLGFSLPIPINMFGFMLATSILLGSWVVSLEVKRLTAVGRLPFVRIKRKHKDSKTGKVTYTDEMVEPAELLGNMTAMAAIFGVTGSRIAHILEYPNEFVADPWGMIFSRGGFSFYGGLILATLAIAYYVKSKGLSVKQMADAIAPSLMLGYGVGRLGCQLAGDGDWGIPADMTKKPEWLPDWIWAQTYDGNVLGVVIDPPGVYPTPMYEVVACLILFAIIWQFRKHPYLSGWLFSFYMILNGIERFFIEKIRVNATYDIFGLEPTQAEIVSSLLVLFGLIGVFYFGKRMPAHMKATVMQSPRPSDKETVLKNPGKKARKK